MDQVGSSSRKGKKTQQEHIKPKLGLHQPGEGKRLRV